MKASILRTGLLAATLACGGCGDNLLGTYVVVDGDKTVAGIEAMRSSLSNEMSLAEYRSQFKERYTDKSLRFTSQPPHTFIFPVPLEGSVEGLLNGGWMRDKQNKDAVLVYRWVSGSMYELWGRGVLTNGNLQVSLELPMNGEVLHFKKVR